MALDVLCAYLNRSTYNSYGTRFIQQSELLPAPRYIRGILSPRYPVYVSPFGNVYLSHHIYYVRVQSKAVDEITERIDGVFCNNGQTFTELQKAVDFALSVYYAHHLGFRVLNGIISF